MSYTKDEQTVFVSLALGEFYREVISTQIQSVLKNTYSDLYILTDDPGYWGTYYGSRIHFIRFDQSTDLGLSLTSTNGVFNYNLKVAALSYIVRNVRPENIIWMDADTWIFSDFPRNIGSYFFEQSSGVLATRFRQKMNDPDILEHPIIIEKLELMGIDRLSIEARLPIENVMIMKNGTTLETFIESWHKYAKLSYETGCTGFYEAVEVCLAIQESGIDCKIVEGTTYNFADCFRTLHLNASNPAKVIHNPFIV